MVTSTQTVETVNPKISLSRKAFYPHRKYKSSKVEKNSSMDKKEAPSPNEKEGQTEGTLKYRTELCKFYEINGQCKFGDKCIFAHGKENLREKVLNKSGYKKRACINFFEHGFCMYGNRCQFSHEVKDSHCNKFSYKKLLKDINKGSLNSDIIEEVKEKPILSVFKQIHKSNKEKGKKINTDYDYINDILSLNTDALRI